MATLYLSALVNRIKGRLGDVVYAWIYGRQIAKIVSKDPAVPETSRTIQLRANMKLVRSKWYDLPIGLRQVWDSYAASKSKHWLGYHAFISHNLALLNSSHDDLSLIQSPPKVVSTATGPKNICIFAVDTCITTVTWPKPKKTTEYVTLWYRLPPEFCRLFPCFGLCPTVGYNSFNHFVETVRADQHFINHSFDYPQGTPLIYQLRTIDNFGRRSPRTHLIRYDTPSNLDYIYVADYYNHRIKKLSRYDLSFIAQVGSEGEGDYQYSYPRGMATDNIYIYFSDSGNNRIIKLKKSDLSFVAEFNGLGPPENHFSNPFGLCVDSCFVFLCDTDNHRIFKLNKSDLSFVAKIGSLGSGDDNFNLPYNLFVNTAFIFVCDSLNHRISIRSKDDLSFISSFGSFGSGDGQFNTPQSIFVDFDYIYISDTLNHRICRFLLSDFSFVDSIGSLGSGDNQFNEPNGLYSDAFFLYVCDRKNHRIVRLNKSDFTWNTSFGSLGSGDDQFSNPRGISGDVLCFFIHDIFR